MLMTTLNGVFNLLHVFVSIVPAVAIYGAVLRSLPFLRRYVTPIPLLRRSA